jgi:hypothetical protein
MSSVRPSSITTPPIPTTGLSGYSLAIPFFFHPSC